MRKLFLIVLFFTLAFLLKSAASDSAYASVTVKVTLDNMDGAVNTSAVVDIYKTVSGAPALLISQYSPVSRYTTPGTGQAIVQYTNSTDSGTNTPYTIRWSNPYCGGGGTGTAIFNPASGFYEITQNVRCTTINSIVNMSALSCVTTTGTVSWNVSNNNGGYPNVSSFKVYKALSGSSFGTTFQSVAFAGTANQSTYTSSYSASLTGLSTGVWVVRVVALPNNPDQDNFTVNDVNLACGTAVVPPTAPIASFSSCGSSTSTVTFTWNAATPGTFTYGVQVLDQATNPSNPGPSNWGVTPIPQIGNVTMATTSLNSNHTYWANVVATSSGGAVYYSMVSSFLVPTSCAVGGGGTSSSYPTNLTATQTCPGGNNPRITFEWDSIGSAGGTIQLNVTTDNFTGDLSSSPYNKSGVQLISVPSGGHASYVWDAGNPLLNSSVYNPPGDANPQTPPGDERIPLSTVTYYWRINEVYLGGTSMWRYPNGSTGTANWPGVPVTISSCTSSQTYHDVKVEVVPNTFRAAGAVTSIAVTNGGNNNYSESSTVSIIGGGGGIGATATLNIVSGRIMDVIVTNGGSGYISAPTFTFANVGSGSSAVLTATIGDGPLQAQSFSAGQTVKFQAQVTNLNVNGGLPLTTVSHLYFYYIGGGSVPNCINTLNNNAQINAPPPDGAIPPTLQDYDVSILGLNDSVPIDIKFKVGSTAGSPTAYLYVIPSCSFADSATDPNWDNNDASFTYNVSVDRFFQATGGDVGAAGLNGEARTIQVGQGSSLLNMYQSDYLLAANKINTAQVKSGGFKMVDYGARKLFDGGVYSYFYDRFWKTASATSPDCEIGAGESMGSDVFKYCNGDVTIPVGSARTVSGNFTYFINGNLNIGADLKLSANADTAIYVVGGNINVDVSVKNIQGVFITLGTFSDCAAVCITAGSALSDALLVNGSVYADGTMALNRTFPANNSTLPSDIFAFEPKYLLVFNVNSKLSDAPVGWKEVSP